MIRVVIIDDHVVVRAGLRYIIEADPELEFAGEFGGGVGAVGMSVKDRLRLFPFGTLVGATTTVTSVLVYLLLNML